MKRYIVILFLLPLFSTAQKGFVISGNLKGLKEKDLVSITDAKNLSDTLAKSFVSEEKFVLKGSVPEPGLYNINSSNLKKKGLLFLDNSAVSVSGNAEDIQKIIVTGSASHKDFEDFQTVFNPLFENLNQLAGQIKTTGLNDSLKDKSDEALSSIQAAVDQFLKGRKSSYVSPFLLMVTSQLSENIQLLETRFNNLASNVKEGYYGKMIAVELEKSKIGAVGSPAIDFTQNDPEGKPVSLSSFKGKYVLVDFWASWCGPCRQENPNVVNTYMTFKDKNFTVLGVSLDRSREPWLKAIKDDNLTWTHVSDLKFWGNEAAQKYKIEAIPQNFLVGPDGKIIARNLRGPMLPERLAELLK